MKKQERKRLGDLLIEAGLITKEQLEETLKEKAPGQKLGDALLQRGYITEQQLIEVLEFQLGIPHVSLYRYPIDPKLMNLVPKEFAKRNMLIPLKQEGDRLFVAMADPMDFLRSMICACRQVFISKWPLPQRTIFYEPLISIMILTTRLKSF